jgi:hypothetical protein
MSRLLVPYRLAICKGIVATNWDGYNLKLIRMELDGVCNRSRLDRRPTERFTCFRAFLRLRRAFSPVHGTYFVFLTFWPQS